MGLQSNREKRKKRTVSDAHTNHDVLPPSLACSWSELMAAERLSGFSLRSSSASVVAVAEVTMTGVRPAISYAHSVKAES
jgi:hypothetical protein